MLKLNISRKDKVFGESVAKLNHFIESENNAAIELNQFSAGINKSSKTK